MNSERRMADGGWRTVDGGRWTADGGRRTVDGQDGTARTVVHRAAGNVGSAGSVGRRQYRHSGVVTGARQRRPYLRLSQPVWPPPAAAEITTAASRTPRRPPPISRSTGLLRWNAEVIRGRGEGGRERMCTALSATHSSITRRIVSTGKSPGSVGTSLIRNWDCGLYQTLTQSRCVLFKQYLISARIKAGLGEVKTPED